jgi:cytochrome oxidase Cu insertion factor (SCO1/SenC/PrrC family)
MKYKKVILGVIVAAVGFGLWTNTDERLGNLNFWSFMPRSFAVVFGPKEVKGFEMTDHNNRRVTQDSYAGKYLLVFFGYTYCPDVCPTSLSDISQVLDILGPKGNKIVPLFVSVDPERDTPEHLKEYIENFHPNFVGLTGSDDQISSMARNYKVAYLKMTNEEDDPETYFMGHTSTIFLSGPAGQTITSFNNKVKPAVMAETIGSILLR